MLDKNFGNLEPEIIMQSKFGHLKNAWLAIKTFVHPKSIHDTGTTRLISLDFLRGFAIFVMLYVHEI